MPDNRDAAGRFQKGKSGNPGGRKPMDAATKKMLCEATPEAAALLIDTLRNCETDIKLRVHVAEVILDRVYGKSSQPIVADVDNVVRLVLAEELKGYAN